MISGFIAKYITPYALWILAGLLAVATAAAGVQTLRLAWLQTSVAEKKGEAILDAFKTYDKKVRQLDEVSEKLVATQKERDDALRVSGQKIIRYVRTPAAAVQCMDADGLQLVAELARGKPADSGAPAGQVPGRATGAD